jgi:hypothetical protein
MVKWLNNEEPRMKSVLLANVIWRVVTEVAFLDCCLHLLDVKMKNNQ